MNITIIGLGGIGGNLCRLLNMQSDPGEHHITGIDGDTVESSNLERQMYFSEKDIGVPKATCLRNANVIQRALVGWFPETICADVGLSPEEDTPSPDVIFCCADNLVARRKALEFSDRAGIPVIITGNETTSAQAYIYLPVWQGTRNDIRNIFAELQPVVLEVNTAPVVRESCWDGVNANPQTVMANTLAATYGFYLFETYRKIGFDSEKVTRMHPIYHKGDLGGMTSWYYKEKKKK